MNPGVTRSWPGRKMENITGYVDDFPKILFLTISLPPSYASWPIHTAPPILSLLAPVTDASTLFSSRQRSTPINAMINASL